MKSVYIKNMLAQIGYGNEYFSENYTVQIDGTSAVMFDYVAFSDKYLKDISTSCIAIQEVKNNGEEVKYIDGAKYLAVPLVVISIDNHVRVWNIKTQEDVLLNDNEDNIIHLYFEKNRFEFMPDNLINAKTGYRQLDIFETTGLIDFSRKAICKILSEEFEKGLIAAKEYLEKQKKINSRDLDNITSITMHVISALIINSKLKSEGTVPDIFELLKSLSQTYKEYFSDSLMFKYGQELLSEIYKSLNLGINYQSIDHELLGYFYESTLLQFSERKAKNIRKEFGIYYTPKVLSREIISNIPIENIPMDKRYIFDGTCGSGSLLLSACERLEELVKYEKTDIENYNYLARMIEGYDKDEFASEVAGVSLLLYSLPFENKWNIHSGDLLYMNETKIQVPYVILGNPPYKETRKNGLKEQEAVKFLDKYFDLLHDDGYIGIILPESFLQNDSAILQREKLLNQFDIMELWILHGRVFKNNCTTIVIIAQKKEMQGENLTKIKLLSENKNSVNKYFKQNKWDFELFFNVQESWKKREKFKISISPVEDILQKIVKDRKTLDDITENVTGIIMSPKFHFSEIESDGYVPYIVNAIGFRKYVISKKMRSNIKYLNYNMSDKDERKIEEGYKGLRLRRNYESIYSAKCKVLVKMSSTQGKIDCISAFTDEDGFYPSHSFFVFVSNDKRISNYVICALINSKVVNAFVRKECVKRTLTTDVIRSIPVPRFTDLQINNIEECYIRIKDAYMSNEEKKVDEIQKEIDNIIFEAFGLQQEECDKINNLFAVYNGECIEEDTSNVKTIDIKTTDYYNVSGQVDYVNLKEMYCNIFLAEFGEQKIKIVSSMPGWFLRKGAEFSAKYCKGTLFDIKPLVYSYLSDEELIMFLDNEIAE